MKTDILGAIQSRLWAIKLERLRELTLLARQYDTAAEASKELLEQQWERQAALNTDKSFGRVKVIPIIGDIQYRLDFWAMLFGGVSTLEIGKRFDRAVADDTVKAIVLNIDSPGGTVEGTPELADKVFKAREAKRIVAVANPLMASAAYWIGAAAHEVVITPSGEAGSIGVWSAHIDWSEYEAKLGIKTTLISAGKHKVEANPWEPLSDEAKERWQQDIDHYYLMFLKDVARFRGTSAAKVKAGYGEGRCVPAQEAKALGLVDRIATLEQTVERLKGRAGARTKRSSNAREQKLRLTRQRLGL